MTGDQFAVAVEALIVQGRAAGLTDEAIESCANCRYAAYEGSDAASAGD
jgi:hypothetical protein